MPHADQMTRESTLGLQDGPSEKADGNRKCPNCEALLQDNIGYDACPSCGRLLTKASKYRIARPTTQWQCPECGEWNYQAAGARGGEAWHDCQSCGHKEGPRPQDYQRRQSPADWDEDEQGEYDYDDWVPLDRTSKFRVVSLGELQQPGGVGATQPGGLVNATSPSADQSPDTGPGIEADAGQNSYEQNVALETWVNYAVDMLNRGKDEQTVLARLAHDGCPDPEGVMKRAMEQPEESPVPSEGTEDPFDIPFSDESSAQEQSVSHQPPVNQSTSKTAKTAKTAKTCPECEEGTMHEDDHVFICSKCGYETSEPDDDDDDDDNDGEWIKPWEKDSFWQPDPARIYLSSDELQDGKPSKKPDQELQIVDEPSGENQADLFDVDEPEGTDNSSPPIKFKQKVPVQDTKKFKGAVRIKDSSWKGEVIEEWEDLWGQKLLKVALSDGGTVNVAPSQVVADDPTAMDHPVTEIQRFIDSLDPVQPTRPSIMARLANMELVRRAVRANISKVGFSDQLTLEQFDLRAQEETQALREILPALSRRGDKEYLAGLPRYRAGDGTRDQDPEFNAKLQEHAAVFVSELEPELRADTTQLAYAAAKYAESHNGHIPEFVKAAQKYASPGPKE